MTIKAHSKFKAEVYLLSKAEGGRLVPYFSVHRLNFYFQTAQLSGTIYFPQNIEPIMPGTNFSIEAEIDTPVAMSNGLRFAIREDGRTVGAGFVSQIIDN